MSKTLAWKYLAPETARKVLENRTLRFSPLNDRKDGVVIPVLNDRTDCAFDLSDEVARLMRTEFRGRIVNRSRTLRDPSDTPERTIEKSIRHQLRGNGLRILSLSHTSPLTAGANPLWGYYGASSQGLCLEFDQDALVAALEEDLRRGVEQGFKTRHVARKIVYNDVAPKYPEPALSSELKSERMIEAAFRKDSAWDHENEFRVVICVDKNLPGKSILKLPLFTWVFPKHILLRIHLGEYCNKETAEFARRLADTIPVRSHI